MNKSGFLLSTVLLFVAVSCHVSEYIPEITTRDMDRHVRYLASDELQGRYPGTDGDNKASEYITRMFRDAGLMPVRQEFSFIRSVRRGPDNRFLVDGIPAAAELYTPLAFSGDTLIKAQLVFAGYGITVKTDSFEWDDYLGLDVKQKWVLVMRGYPEVAEASDYLSMASDDRDKAMLALDNGAAGIILVSGYRLGAGDPLVAVDRKQASADIPAFHIRRELADSLLKPYNHTIRSIEDQCMADARSISFQTSRQIEAKPDIQNVSANTGNCYALLKGTDPLLSNEYLVIGAHYDHLGTGGEGSSSRMPGITGIHNGADDNASGVAMMLELAGKLAAERGKLKRSVIFVAFGAEEMGLLGSKYFVNHLPVDPSKLTGMINLDMVGRLDTAKGLQIGGAGTSIEADSMIKVANTSGLKLKLSREGNGPSDHSSFYGRNVPVFFITTGAHTDYHTPDDDPNRININGMIAVADFTDRLAVAVADAGKPLTFTEAGPRESAGPGYRFKVTLGFMPDFSSTDIEGVRVDFVSKGKAAERGGIRNGDIITAIDGLAVKNIYDYMYRLGKLSRNQIISVEILRGGKKEVLLIQL